MASSTSGIPEGKEKLKKSGSMGSSDAYVRADKIDLTSLDIQLEKQLAKTWGKANPKAQGPKEDWEIDPAKLEIRYFITQGTYGTVYRGTYDGQDVAVLVWYSALGFQHRVHTRDEWIFSLTLSLDNPCTWR